MYEQINNNNMKVTACIEKQPGAKNCSCFLEESIDKVRLVGYGTTVDDAVNDLLEARKEAIEMGRNIPELEFTFKYDLWAFFDKFPMNATIVAKQIGINASLMRQYISGNKQPSKKRIEEIQEGIRMIGKQLSDVSLVRY